MHHLHFTRDDILRLLPLAHECKSEVAERLQWLLYFAEHRSISRTCRHFGIARSTFYRWACRFDPGNIRSLEDQPTTNGGVVEAPVCAAEEVPQTPPKTVLKPFTTPQALFTGLLINLLLMIFILTMTLFDVMREQESLHASPPAVMELRLLGNPSGLRLLK